MPMPMALRAFDAGRGVVSSFDEPRGLGAITTADGADLPFHCTAIADGTRTISVGERVRFQVVAGPMGRWEAARIEAG
ncbi:MAG TPA: cold shock domain-containing protein [Acidimicrobiales bacterium]|nr:cold shock domain-containing protein [Acidimicrobiales bacterium]